MDGGGGRVWTEEDAGGWRVRGRREDLDPDTPPGEARLPDR